MCKSKKNCCLRPQEHKANDYITFISIRILQLFSSITFYHALSLDFVELNGTGIMVHLDWSRGTEPLSNASKLSVQLKEARFAAIVESNILDLSLIKLPALLFESIELERWKWSSVWLYLYSAIVTLWFYNNSRARIYLLVDFFTRFIDFSKVPWNSLESFEILKLWFKTNEAFIDRI